MALPQLTEVGTVITVPELRNTTGGTPVANARMAFNKSKRDEQTGKWVDDKTLYLDVTLWGDQAERFVEQVDEQGTQVFVTGELSTEEWTDQQTQAPRSKVVLTIRRFKPFPRGEAPAGQQGQQRQQRPGPRPASQARREGGRPPQGQRRPQGQQRGGYAPEADPWQPGPSQGGQPFDWGSAGQPADDGYRGGYDR